jgi:hypothetical protein
MNEVSSIICIPGLGGHPSVFNGYTGLFSGYKLYPITIIDRRKAIEDIKEIIRKEGKVIFICSCYGIQLALEIVDEMPSAADQLIVIEAFFAEFQWWKKPAILINNVLMFLCRITDWLGLRRKKLYWQSVDYSKLGKYPIFVQPVFDMAWHNLTDYFIKLNDILTYKLPEKVEIKTLFVLSPHGFIQSPKIKKRLAEIFVNSEIVEISKKGHNIITNSQKLTAVPVREWLAKNNNL